MKSFLPFKSTYLICFLFFLLYSLLSITRHNNYNSFGFDLGLADQVVWQYSHFSLPITSIHFYPFTSLLTDHIELIYAPLGVFYWIWNDVRMLLLLQAAIFSFSGVPIYLLAKRKKLKTPIATAILLSYLSFYGVQNALWFDVHSAVFGAAFLSWFIYFLDKKKLLWATIFFILTIICKENLAMLTFSTSLVYWWITKQRAFLYYAFASLTYLFFIFGIYFPHLTERGYGYQNTNGILSDLNLFYLFDTAEKRYAEFVSVAWFGFLPLLSPFFLLPAVGDFFSYFVIANQLKEAQGIFMHYRITIAPMMTFATIMTIAKYKRLNNIYVAGYLFLCILFFQYTLHLPISYIAKKWFWEKPAAVYTINKVLTALPEQASVVSQNNIVPHISHRREIFTLWPEKKSFTTHSPCGKKTCAWFRWGGTPKYLIVDTANEWDSRHLLAPREEYIAGLQNLEKTGIIKRYKQEGTTILYKVQNP